MLPAVGKGPGVWCLDKGSAVEGVPKVESCNAGVCQLQGGQSLPKELSTLESHQERKCMGAATGNFCTGKVVKAHLGTLNRGNAPNGPTEPECPAPGVCG